MHDIRDAFRSLRSTPIVTAVAVLSLALGIGANTAIFSIIDSLVLKSLPVHEPRQLAIVNLATETTSFTNPIWEQVRDRQSVVDGAAAWGSTRFNLAQGGQAEMVDGIWVSGSYFDVLGVPALLGRTFSPEDDRRGGGPNGPVTVISYAFWQKRFGGAADVLGRSMVIERVPYTIIGVTPPHFFGTEVGRTFDVVIPLGTEPLVRGKESTLDRRSNWWLRIIVRRKAGQDLQAATAAMRGIQPQVREATLPENWRPEDIKAYLAEPFTLSDASTGTSALRTRYQRPLTTIMVVVALVLLIACANIANLLLARASARRHEMSVRLALGASRTRLFRQLLAESLVLSGMGALLGTVFALWGSRLLVRQLSTSTTNVFLSVGVDWRMLAFTSAIAVATALLFGLAPALRGVRVQPNEALKEQGRGTSVERRFSMGNLLVVAQVALSLILLVAAGLFLRTFSSLATLDLGFDRDPVLVVNVGAQRLALEPAQRAPLFERLREAARAQPGVASAALSAVTPVSGSSWQFLVEIPGGPALPERDRAVLVNMVSPDFFRTLGTRLVAGRDFSAGDRLGAPDVAIVNEAFAKKFFNGANPVGRVVRQPAWPERPASEHQVVGLVQNATYRSLREELRPILYLPLSQSSAPPSGISLSVRAAAGSPILLTRSLADALGAVHRDLTLSFRPLKDLVNAGLIQERVVALLSGFFGALALLLAGLGLYGITAYAVNRRKGELGIRMALGAAPATVVRLVLQRVALLVGLGIVAGLALSGAFILYGGTIGAQTVAGLLHGVELRDPVTFGGAIVVLAAIAAFAGWLPARRASRIDPASVLRA